MEQSSNQAINQLINQSVCSFKKEKTLSNSPSTENASTFTYLSRSKNSPQKIPSFRKVICFSKIKLLNLFFLHNLFNTSNCHQNSIGTWIKSNSIHCKLWFQTEFKFKLKIFNFHFSFFIFFSSKLEKNLKWQRTTTDYWWMTTRHPWRTFSADSVHRPCSVG